MKSLTLVVVAVSLLALQLPSAQALQPQIPTPQVCNQSAVSGQAKVEIKSRSSLINSGTFGLSIEVKCYPADYPQLGVVELVIDMSDSSIQGTVKATTLEQLTTTGKHSPTAYLSGRCDSQPSPTGAKIQGCRYWLMVADNSKAQDGTPDVIGFLIMDGNGKRVAYGTGPVIRGDVVVAPTPY